MQIIVKTFLIAVIRLLWLPAGVQADPFATMFTYQGQSPPSPGTMNRVHLPSIAPRRSHALTDSIHRSWRWR